MEKFKTSIAAEFAVAAELSRRGFNVGITFGNTKKNYLLAEKDGKTWKIQVKGIKQKRNNNFRISINSLDQDCWYVFVNVNRIDLSLGWEFAVLNYSEVLMNLRRRADYNDNALKTNILDNPVYRNSWNRFNATF